MIRFSPESQDRLDVIGTVAIDGQRSSIEVQSAYLDSWLAGLLDCLLAAVNGSNVYEVDLVEESNPLVLRADGDVLSLRFGDQTAELGPLEPAIHEIASEIRHLLQRYRLSNEALLQEIETKLSHLRS